MCNWMTKTKDVTKGTFVWWNPRVWRILNALVLAPGTFIPIRGLRPSGSPTAIATNETPSRRIDDIWEWSFQLPIANCSLPIQCTSVRGRSVRKIRTPCIFRDAPGWRSDNRRHCGLSTFRDSVRGIPANTAGRIYNDSGQFERFFSWLFFKWAVHSLGNKRIIIHYSRHTVFNDDDSLDLPQNLSFTMNCCSFFREYVIVNNE